MSSQIQKAYSWPEKVGHCTPDRIEKRYCSQMASEAPGTQAYFPSAMHRVKDISTANDNRGSTYHFEVNEHIIILLCLQDEFKNLEIQTCRKEGRGWDNSRASRKVVDYGVITFIRMFDFVDVF